MLPLKAQHCKEVELLAKCCLPERVTEEMLKDTLKYDYNHFFVAQSKNHIVGFAGMMVLMDEAELLYIAVDKDYRQNGIGRKLLNEVKVTASLHNAKRLLLEVRKQNENARRFYHNRDFSVIGERKDYYSDPLDDALIMECRFEKE